MEEEEEGPEVQSARHLSEVAHEFSSRGQGWWRRLWPAERCVQPG